MLEKGEYPRRDELIDRLLDQGHTPTDIASALLHMLGGESKQLASASDDLAVPSGRDRDRGDRGDRGDRDQGRDRYSDRNDRGDSRGSRDRAPRRDSRDNPSDFSSEPGMTRLIFTAGKINEVRPADFVGAIAGGADLDRSVIGAIFIQPKHTLVDIADSAVSTVLDKLNGIRFKGKRLSVFVPDAKD
jgi:ATP-dependent RNA helicase DeaD